MSGETSDTQPISERIKQSPIHQWAVNFGIDMGNGQKIIGIEPFFDAIHIPSKLRDPFHELLIERGQYSWDITEDDAKKFGEAAFRITIQYEMLPEEANALLYIFTPIIGQWIEFNRNLKSI